MPNLFNRKTIDKHRSGAATLPEAHLAVLQPWAESITSGTIYGQGELALHGDFKARIVEDVLGYTRFGVRETWSCSAERQMGRGPVDLALGDFRSNADESTILAAIELKGADTKDLDAIMPGRKLTPVQQAWNYAVAVKGCRWVLVSNYVELRLYAFGQGTQHYEQFRFDQLIDITEYERFMLLLSAEKLLSGATESLLLESQRADRDITDDLYADYKALRGSLMAAVDEAAPEMDAEQRIAVAQTVLDRVLFVAFAEDTGLLPRNTLQKAFEHHDPYNPRPIWDNFKGLFRRIDVGDPSNYEPLEGRILKYNGGLFQRDQRIENLALSDAVCEGFKQIGQYDFQSEVGVTILGHIFEQSITDMERLIAQARGEEPVEAKSVGTSGRRKRDGVVYTPDYVARFIVEQTLGTHMREIFTDCVEPRITRVSSVTDYENIQWRNRNAELQAWREYQERISKLRVVDPACGSGVFLVMAFDYMKAEYKRTSTKIAELMIARGDRSGGDLFEPDSEILSRNLFGVDVNAESVEITKLSLWIKTARRGKVLDSLDENIRVGDSLIEDKSYAYREHGFNWRESFPEVFAEGGFDICLGNPPYVRMERIKPMKRYLRGAYEVVADRADLYAYFYERGLRLLKAGGRLGYVSSSSFFKARFGRALRRYLRTKSTIETVVEFGDHSLFDGVVTYPVVMVIRSNHAPEDQQIKFCHLNARPDGEFSVEFDAIADVFPQSALSDGSWHLERQDIRSLREKVRKGGIPLEDVFGLPKYGVKTGKNEAFYVDAETRDALIADDPRSEELLVPLAVGDDCYRWAVERNQRWLIYIPKNAVNIDDYKAVKSHLLKYKTSLEKRSTKQRWFELQQSQSRYIDEFASTKIVYPEMSQGQKFSIVRGSLFINNKAFYIPREDFELLGFLNSQVCWFFLGGIASPLRGGVWRLELRDEYIRQIPVPQSVISGESGLAPLAIAATEAANRRREEQRQFRRRIPDLCPEGQQTKLNNKLHAWWLLEDFPSFRKAVKAHYRGDIPPRLANEWEDFFTEKRNAVERCAANIAAAEAEINQRVYEFFDLTPDEIRRVEAAIR